MYLGFCGGALISPRIVLSAYHCVKKGKTFIVILGHNTVDNGILNKAGGIQDFYSIPIVYIKTPKSGYQKDDVAILILKSPAKFSERVQPICLPEQDQVFSDVRAVTAGWGRTGRSSTRPPDLRKVTLTVVDKKDLNYGRYKNMLDTKLVKNKDGKYKDPCRGDSGILKLYP